MFKNYCTVAWRHLKGHKLFSVINIACLGMGICFFMIIGLYSMHEKAVNSDLRHAGRQYLIKSNWKVKDMGLDVTTLGPLAKAVRNEYPSLVAGYYRYNPVTNVVSAGDRYFKEDIAIGDTTLVSMYGFKVLHGNAARPFTNNQSAVITASMAEKLFGRTDVLGQMVRIQTTQRDAQQTFTVSAVLEDIPYNSVTGLLGDQYQVFLPSEDNHYFNDQAKDVLDNWADVFKVGLIELQPGVTPADLVVPFRQLLAKYTRSPVPENLTVQLVPLRDYHLQNGSVQTMITTLSLTALFILLMAVINFININTGTAAYRLKEIGLRKIMGGSRSALIAQYLIEAVMLALLAGLLSLGLYQLLRPLFSQLLHTRLDNIWHFSLEQVFFVLLLVLVVGLASGIYPAFVLSASNTLLAAKGKTNTPQGGLLLRKGLLVVQFTMAVVVFICALNVSRQVKYCFRKDLGYNKDNVLVLYTYPKQWDTAGVMRMNAVKKALQQLPEVSSASLAFEVPDRRPPNAMSILVPAAGGAERVSITTFVADENYAATFGLHMLAGSFFKQGAGGHIPGQVVLNEAAVKALKLDNPVGQQLVLDDGKNTVLTIAGVVKNYNYSNMQEGIGPVAVVHVNDATAYRFLSLKIASADIPAAIETIRRKWKTLLPGSPFEFFFMDERFRWLYQTELQLQKAANIAMVLSLLIVLMGIFGIVAFTLTRRTKEMALRKVLGAGAARIIWLFIKEYAWLILLANAIAWPLAYWLTSQWLNGYHYRMQQTIWSFIGVGAMVLLAAFALIVLQCLRVARDNPVKSLRTE